MPKRLSKREASRFLRGRRVGVLGTIGRDGQPVLTPIWYLYRKGELLMRTSRSSVKAQNVLRDGRASLCVQDERPPYASVTVYGSARIEDERPGLATDIARHYLGAVAGRAYLQIAADSVEQPGGEVTIVLTPQRMLTQDFSAETPAYAQLWLKAKRFLPPWL
jgi:PPOX class probable F420-dependent enzyme